MEWHSSNYATVTIMPVGAELSFFLELPWCLKVGTGRGRGGGINYAKKQAVSIQKGSWVKIFEKKANPESMSIKSEAGLWKVWLE